MKSKRFLALLTALLLLLLTPAAIGETASLSGAAQVLFDTVKWSTAFPKDAQVVQGCEYMCKVEDQNLRLILAEVTQQELIQSFMGDSSRLILIDQDSDLVITYLNFTEPDYANIATHEDALMLLFNHYFSHTAYGSNPIYAESEMVYPISEEEIQQINAELAAYFIPQK